MSNSRYTAVKIQKDLHKILEQKVLSDGYGMKGKSKWIAEAIENFLELRNYPVLIDIAMLANNYDHILSIRLTKEIFNKIEDAVVTVRKEFPAISAVQSLLIRASIMQRLIRNSSD